jgi:hypothetical protein
MRIRCRILPLLSLAVVITTLPVQAQEARSERADVARVRDQRFKWFFGASGGAMFFETQSRTRAGIPTAGAHLAIVARRAGLMLGVDEAFGNNESTAFLDRSTGGGAPTFQQRSVTFDHIRRYAFTMTGYPVRGMLEPYIGLGFGINQVINPQVLGVFTSNEEAAVSTAAAREVSAAGFASLMAGVQFRVGRLSAFGQYQINTAPAADNLLRGPLHMLTGGLRFSLGSAKEDIKGGGY